MKTLHPIILALLFGCTNVTGTTNTGENTKTSPIADASTEKINDDRDALKTYAVLFDTALSYKGENVNTLALRLASHFENYRFTNSSDERKERTKEIKAGSFLKLLANDFKNEHFTKAAAIYFSYIVPQGERYDYLKVEEFYFKDEAQAGSCFESLKNYESVTIHFKTINWIWVRQANSLFLISALNYNTGSDVMQKVKEDLTKSLENKGPYNTISFYE